ncbi:transglutaminase-like cysteine peptidase [Tianweitania populi]|uniref:Transglutaminase n=1 Tax=Tianweitania populi TaxID=1607949 RepID=A0A8J3DXR0_9HYPH|nr:transglutaminase-like cysteine peptidase [Tianweitania populi]GHD17015.1 transglutaminase [Tianweitania populi]
MKVARGWTQAILLAGALVFSAVSVSAGGQAKAAAMDVGGITSQPIGHYEFCKRYPGDCAIRSSNVKPVALTDATFGLIARVNQTVNRSVEPVSDNDLYGRQEWWAYPSEGGQRGDCEDFALQKRRVLMQRGISSANLLMTVVRKPDGEGHAVLTVRTDHGDYILDNLNDQVLAWEQTGYRFLKRQAENHSGRWNSIRGGSTSPLVGAVRSTTN